MGRVSILRNIIAGVALCLIVPAGFAYAQGPLGQILNRLDAHNKALTSIRADVTMVIHNPQLNVSDTYRGSTSYLPAKGKRGAYLRHDWASPLVENISVIGDKYELYSPSQNLVYVGKTEKGKGGAKVGGALAFMNMSKEQLRASYTTRYLGEEQISGGVKTWHLELTPINKTSYKSAELWVDGDGMPRQAKIIEMNNDTRTVLLSNIQKNVTIKGDIFKLKYPGTVKRVPV